MYYFHNMKFDKLFKNIFFKKGFSKVVTWQNNYFEFAAAIFFV